MTSDTAKLKERLRRVSEYGGTHLNGLWSEAADEIERLEAEREEVCRIIAGNTKIANLPPYIQSLCNSLDDAEAERDEAVGHLKGLVRYADAVRMNAGIGKNQAERLEAARDFLGKIKKHKEAGADE